MTPAKTSTRATRAHPRSRLTRATPGWEVVASRTSTVGNRFMFTGREWDEVGEFYHYRHRTYSPYEIRFMRRDPIGLAGGWNVYAYCGGDPVNASDPMGLDIIVVGIPTTVLGISGFHTVMYMTDANLIVECFDPAPGTTIPIQPISVNHASTDDRGSGCATGFFKIRNRVLKGTFDRKKSAWSGNVQEYTFKTVLAWGGVHEFARFTDAKRSELEENIVRTFVGASGRHWSGFVNCNTELHRQFEEVIDGELMRLIPLEDGLRRFREIRSRVDRNGFVFTVAMGKVAEWTRDSKDWRVGLTRHALR